MNMIEPGSQQTIDAYTINSVTFKSKFFSRISVLYSTGCILVLFALWLLESQQEIDINGERHSLLSESEPLKYLIFTWVVVMFCTCLNCKIFLKEI